VRNGWLVCKKEKSEKVKNVESRRRGALKFELFLTMGLKGEGGDGGEGSRKGGSLCKRRDRGGIGSE